MAESSRHMLAYTLLALTLISVVSGIFVWYEVHRPVTALKAGTERLAEGELGYQIPVTSHDELGELANSFNSMSLQLRGANEEVLSWARTLEERVEQKTAELRRVYEQVIHVEKMASIGKMAAVVAHEINNPLSGILTYSKLLRKWHDRDGGCAKREDEVRQCLELIESESRRCGDLVKNLLTFSRTSPINLEWADLNSVIERCVRLVLHQFEMNNIQWQEDFAEALPAVQCDPAQIEQVVLGLVMNAIDAMPRGGNLWLSTRVLSDGAEVEIKVRDDGAGIPPDLMPHMFEPFMTTKESGHGMGLAIARSIVERHRGRISVESELGQGATFTVVLPVGGNPAATAAQEPLAAAQAR